MTILMSKELEEILSNDFSSSLIDNSDSSLEEHVMTINENPFFVLYYIDGHREKFEFKFYNDDHKALKEYLDLRGKRTVIKSLFSDKVVLIEKVKVNFSKNKASLKGLVL